MGQRKMHEPIEPWTVPQEDEIDYQGRYRAFAIRWYSAAFLLVLWLPVSAYTLYYCRFVIHSAGRAAFVITIWTTVMLAAIWWQGQFRCPRCRRRYAALGNKRTDVNYTLGMFDRVCTNCHLKKFEKG